MKRIRVFLCSTLTIRDFKSPTINPLVRCFSHVQALTPPSGRFPVPSRHLLRLQQSQSNSHPPTPARPRRWSLVYPLPSWLSLLFIFLIASYGRCAHVTTSQHTRFPVTGMTTSSYLKINNGASSQPHCRRGIIDFRCKLPHSVLVYPVDHFRGASFKLLTIFSGMTVVSSPNMNHGRVPHLKHSPRFRRSEPLVLP